MVTKGPALVLRHYLDYGRRPMADFDIVIKKEGVEEAVKALHENGFRLKDQRPALPRLCSRPPSESRASPQMGRRRRGYSERLAGRLGSVPAPVFAALDGASCQGSAPVSDQV